MNLDEMRKHLKERARHYKLASAEADIIDGATATGTCGACGMNAGGHHEVDGVLYRYKGKWLCGSCHHIAQQREEADPSWKGVLDGPLKLKVTPHGPLAKKIVKELQDKPEERYKWVTELDPLKVKP